ncbi:C45 family peptidase [Patescibacteria group bacterium]|nr:C45 family peptidase [Patescibacteria group bacterium]
MLYKYNNSYIKINNGIQYLRLNEKNYYSTGYAYGTLLLKSKNPIIKFLKKRFVKIILSIIYSITKRHYKFIRIPKEYLEEIRGYADSTGISYNHLFCVNFCFDVLKRYGFHCSTISFFNKNSVLIGRNTDLLPFLTKSALKYAKSIVIDISIPKKRRFTHVSIPLLIGVLNGFNDKGIAVNSHQILYVKEDTKENNLATHLLMRMLLENISNLKDGELFIKNNITMRSLNLVLTSEKEKKSIIFEINPSKINLIESNGPLCCTTHFESKEMQKFHNGPIKSSQIRLKSMNCLVDKYNQITYKDLINILKDYSNGLENKGTGKSLTNEGTYQSFVFDLTNNIILISNGNKKPVSLTGEYVKLKLNNGN